MPDPTTVISVRGRDRAELLAMRDFVYIGRPVFRANVSHWKGSRWGNPFRVGMKRSAAVATLGADLDSDPRRTHLDARLALTFYREWVRRSGLIEAIGELRGRVLGCWCGRFPEDPNLLCHGVTLAQMADALES